MDYNMGKILIRMWKYILTKILTSAVQLWKSKFHKWNFETHQINAGNPQILTEFFARIWILATFVEILPLYI